MDRFFFYLRFIIRLVGRSIGDGATMETDRTLLMRCRSKGCQGRKAGRRRELVTRRDFSACFLMLSLDSCRPGGFVGAEFILAVIGPGPQHPVLGHYCFRRLQFSLQLRTISCHTLFSHRELSLCRILLIVSIGFFQFAS